MDSSMWKVRLFAPDYGEEEKQALVDVIDSGWVAMGEKTAQFEEQFSSYLGGGVGSLAVSSCTAALHIALLALGVGPGDEVIVPALTFIADLNVVEMTGATAVVADIVSLDDWNISIDEVRKKITPKTRAIIALHFAGYPFNPELVTLAKEKGIALIEDTAHAIGGSVDGKMCGTLGDAAAFSFFANKNLPIGEGGMFVSSNPDLLEQGKLIRSHGMSTMSFERHKGRAVSYDVTRPGLNYRMDEFRGALGLVLLAKLEQNNLKRKSIVERYHKRFKETPLQIPFTDLPAGVVPSFHIYPVLLPESVDRSLFIAFLKEKGVQSSVHYPSYSEFSYYRSKNFVSPLADQVSKRVVTLPLYPGMTDQQVGLVIEAVEEFFK